MATVGLIATSPGQSFSVSLFIDHYIVEFNLDRTSVSALYGLGTFTASLSLIWIGRKIDQYGNRLMSALITGGFGLVLLACSLVVGPFTILISFIAIRGLGQGALGLVSTTAIAQWFKRRRGWLIGLSLVAFAVFQRFYLPALQNFIEANGWRAGWILTGTIMLIGILPLMAVFIRDRPEDFGLQPDGDPVIVAPGDGPIPGVEDSKTLKEAMQTPIFWSFTLARVLAGAWGTALVFHQLSIFAGLGHSADVATATYGQAALMTAAFTLLAGWLVDRMAPARLIGLQMLAMIAASGLALVMRADWLLFLYTAAYGAFMGIGSVFDGTVWVTLFGRAHQGAIRGFVATATVIGTAIGPLIFGFAFDTLGSYAASLWLGIVLGAAELVLVLVVARRNPVWS